jgi:hypothetical protein
MNPADGKTATQSPREQLTNPTGSATLSDVEAAREQTALLHGALKALFAEKRRALMMELAAIEKFVGQDPKRCPHCNMLLR